MGYKHIGTLASDIFSLKDCVENHIQSVIKKHLCRDHMLTHYVRTMKAIAITIDCYLILTYFVQKMKSIDTSRE